MDKYVYSKVEDTLTLKYFNDRHNFIFSYPENWSAIEFENDIKDKNLEIVASFISNQDAISDPFQEYINIKITNNIDYDSTSDYIDNYIDDIQNDFKNIKEYKYNI